MSERPNDDWVEVLARLAGSLGLNETRVRWKLMGFRENWSRAKGRGADKARAIGYRHRICPGCSSLQDRSNKVCSDCGASLTPRFLEVLGRLGLAAPEAASVSSTLTLAIVLCYLRTALKAGNILSLDAETLIDSGGNFTPLVSAGEWWRLSTYIFLHAGLWHILFNLLALQQVGPSIEEVFGKGRMLFFFMLTGILAGLGSEMVGLRGVGIGASGSLMGLIGLAAGWGQRDGTGTGREVRNMMVKWGLYTMVFGFVLGADNGAHGAGFLSGAILGFFSKPQWERQGRGAMDGVLGAAGFLAMVGSVLMVLMR